MNKLWQRGWIRGMNSITLGVEIRVHHIHTIPKFLLFSRPSVRPLASQINGGGGGAVCAAVDNVSSFTLRLL
ncbi:hypothetical protein E2C01_003539 [Portunus trituberculatus]|uniref:Uncharacterized protein n=1 Tax=Portunus trituberculatus TaxID=210409 RepID=A0A5B7CRD1_PORTR|nr:hypothetical protein [Portunus trituberculatus]